jgi:alpha-1,3-glucan synthase
MPTSNTAQPVKSLVSLPESSIDSAGGDSDVPSKFTQTGDEKWELDIMDGWPSSIQLNVYNYDDYFYSDTGGDGVLDRLPPNTLAVNFVNMSAPP